jgi:hypothetical protein
LHLAGVCRFHGAHAGRVEPASRPLSSAGFAVIRWRFRAVWTRLSMLRAQVAPGVAEDAAQRAARRQVMVLGACPTSSSVVHGP